MNKKTEKEEKEKGLYIDLCGLSPNDPNPPRAKVSDGPQINRSRKGSKLSAEEKIKKAAKRQKVKKTKVKRLASSLNIEEIAVEESALVVESPIFDEEVPVENIEDVNEWQEEEEETEKAEKAEKAEIKVNVIVETQDEYVPEASIVKNTQRGNVKVDEYGDPIEEVVMKPLPPVGLSIKNPIKLCGLDSYSIIERLYGDIGYFILAEQVIPKIEPTIKLVQLKLDDGRAVNLFLEV